MYVVSDLLQEVNAVLRLQMKSFGGELLFEKELKLKLKPNSAELVFTIPYEIMAKYPANQFLIEAQLYSKPKVLAENVFYFVSPKDLLLPKTTDPEFEIRDDELLVWSKSSLLIKNLYLESSVHLAKNFFDILPQDTIRIPIDESFTLSQIKGFKSLNSLQN